MGRMIAPALVLAAAGCVLYPSHEVMFDGDDDREILVGFDPPALRTEVRVAAPSSLHVWVPGYWWWTGSWAWIDGCWVVPPRPRTSWSSGHWRRHPSGWVWVRGRWRP